MRRTKKEVDDFEAILEEGRRAKKQKRLEKVQLGKNGKMAKMEKKNQGADNVEKVPRQEKSALLTADNNNIKIKTSHLRSHQFRMGCRHIYYNCSI